ncbi:DUF2110 domain-containing protein [Haloglomus irregulare]|mgnify:CR=1 FL=1|jgi:hypothetical protein|uniref:DUF2110 domain-containing protein n=1 Tax=Haloglomus irregulare TaxID=2234134 RepID=A0A554NED1_9EURY|nr:DUF2110 family protein [Haloglomus irregulare]TSD15757.1 DUF2110 domain-containing protein [Haloglomus irregulare]
MVVLATKLYVEGEARERALDSLRSQVRNTVGELDVESSLGVRDDEFPSVTVSGPDATVARNALAAEWGELTPHREPGETYVGTLSRWDDDGVSLDVGFGETVRIAAADLGLGPGDAAQIRQRFGMVQHLPLRYTLDEDGVASLAEVEQDRLYEWTRGTGRLNVNSATRAEVRATVNRAGHAQDIVTVERLGLLEQSVICTEGTDPPGLLSAVGEYLPAELLCVVP